VALDVDAVCKKSSIPIFEEDVKKLKRILEEFITLQDNMDTLYQKLLYFMSVAHSLSSAPHLDDRASDLGECITDLYYCIYDDVVKVQDTWLDHEDLGQYKVIHPANIVLHYPYAPSNDRILRQCIEDVFSALKDLDELADSINTDLATLGMKMTLVELFKPIADLRSTAIPTPRLFDGHHPMLAILEACNKSVPGIAAILKRWAMIDVPYAIEIHERHVTTLQNMSSVAAFFSSVIATALQYSGLLNSSGFATPFNFLWLLSLLLSTTCAIQCQLAIHWHTSQNRRDANYTHRVVKFAAYDAPLPMLGISFVMFLVGLTWFTYSASGHPNFLSIGTTVAAGVVGVFATVFCCCLVGERLAAKLQLTKRQPAKRRSTKSGLKVLGVV